ncbi:SDR family oxidoreductase [Halomarina litorea]|uniref:SDR family oxidoreductase n=1 Tax=Halomarina litorea TaxID=2961595 RepID=UPI0020C46A38|nr:SDR family oxidoreductase [Halomarina sp. BCD28]
MTDDLTEAPTLAREDFLTLDDPYFTRDNVALVTGGGSGIGQAVALGMAENGLTALATDIDEEGLEATAEKADDLGIEGVHTVEGDLTSDEDMDAIVEEAASLGDIKFLVNIAGLQHVAPIEDFPMEQYDLMHDAMLRAPLYLTKRCLPHIRDSEDGVGAVGNMCSIHGHYVTKDKVAYNMAKFGLRGLTQSIAAEGEGKVRAFTVSTAYVKTPLVTNQIADTAQERGISEEEVVEDVMLGQARVKEMMTPAEVANLFTFAFSENGKYLDGGDLLWDGGYTLTYE